MEQGELETKLVTVDPERIDEEAVREAAEILKR